MSAEFLEIAQNASYLLVEDNMLTFYHQLFLEYFAALALCNGSQLPIQPVSPSHIRMIAESNPPPENSLSRAEILNVQVITLWQAASLGRGESTTAKRRLKITAIRPNMNGRWQQSIVMCVGMMTSSQATTFLRQLLPVEPWTVGLCLAKGLLQDSQLFDLTIQTLVEVENQVEFGESSIVFMEMMRTLGTSANHYLEALIKQIPSGNSLRSTAVQFFAQIDDPYKPSRLEKVFRDANATGDLSLIASASMNLFMLWDKQSQHIDILDGYNLRRLTLPNYARSSFEYAWQYQPKSSMTVRRLEYWVDKLDAPKLELEVSIRKNYDGKPGESLGNSVITSVSTEATCGAVQISILQSDFEEDKPIG